MVMAMMKTNQNTSAPKMLAGVWFVSARSKNCFMPPRSIHRSKPIPCSILPTTACKTFYYVAYDQDYQCAYELGDVAQEKPYCILQRLKYPSLRLILHQQNHLCSPFSALPLFSIKLVSRLLVRLSSRLLLDGFLESLPGAEGGYLRGRDLHLLPCLGVDPLPGLALLYVELAKACDLHLFSPFEGIPHDLLEGIHVPLGFRLREAGPLGYLLYEFGLVHAFSSPSLAPPKQRAGSCFCRTRRPTNYYCSFPIAAIGSIAW